MLVVVAGLLAARRDVPAGVQDAGTSNPLALGSALQMAVLFQAVLMLVHLARVTRGASGVFASAAVLGLTDVDALTLSMARDVARTTSLETAATAIAIGVLANTLLKAAIAAAFGSMPFRVIAAGALVAMGVASGVSLALLR
jgi:uncharacterized membrane protein (DUF4010 family)